MARIITPFGKLVMLIDGQEIEYSFKPVANDAILCPDVIDRYKIDIEFIPDGKEHTIPCILPESTNYQRSIESGERLECQAFYSKDRIKLSIGLECEAGYFSDGTRASDTYDYDAEYLENGIAYIIESYTRTSKYVIGVAWIDDVGWEDPIDEKNNRDVQTWFAADPVEMMD